MSIAHAIFRACHEWSLYFNNFSPNVSVLAYPSYNYSSLSLGECIPSSVVSPSTENSANSSRFLFLSILDIQLGKGGQPKGEDLTIDGTGVTGGTTQVLHKLYGFEGFFKYISVLDVFCVGRKLFGRFGSPNG